MGIPAVLVFGIPSHKDEIGSEGYAPNGIVQEAIRAIKRTQPDLAVIGDVCMCEYTSHGHCGILLKDGVSGQRPDVGPSCRNRRLHRPRPAWTSSRRRP